MNDFKTALDLEIHNLSAIVENLPEVRKLRELKRVRELYQGDQSIPTARFPPPPRPFKLHGPVFRVPVGRKMSDERQRALDFASEHLKGQTDPVKTVALLSAIKANGIDIGGADPLNNLSALLSTSGRFIAHGRSGWTLKSPEGHIVSVPPTAGNGNPSAGSAGADHLGITPSGEKGGGT